jgi:hypothetical protein
VCVNETWLNESLDSSEILHDGYIIFRKDRPLRRAGGVLIAIKASTFKSVREFRLPFNLAELEIVSAAVETVTGQKTLFCSCYRPPELGTSWADSFNTFLNLACDNFNNIVLCGDFNLPGIPWDATASVAGASELLLVEALNDHFLSQINKTPTRGDNILDLVISSNNDLTKVTEVLSSERTGIFTDHSAIVFEINSFVKAPLKTSRSVFDYANGDFEGLRNSLNAINLSSFISEGDNDIDRDWQQWKDVFLAAVNDSIPSKKLMGRNPLPWINGTILNMIRRKNTLRQKLRSRPTECLKYKFRCMRTEVKKSLKEARESYFELANADFRTNPKRLWSILKLKSKSRNIPGLVSMENEIHSHQTAEQSNPRENADTPEGIANLFNRYFSSVYTITEDSRLDASCEVTECIADTLVDSLTLSVTEVQEILKTLDISKATGPDGIPAKLLKETASVIAPSLCKLFNKSLRTGEMPRDWKLANMVPIYKKNEREHVENYRPISLLSVISKVLERCILNNIKDQLCKSIPACQHGYLTGKSCVTNLLEALDHVGSLLDHGEQIDLVYLDMSKAFDMVSHNRLIQKLYKAGFSGNLLKWFRSYLSERRQRVTVMGATSDELPVTSGVPQGSILGPVFFLLYVSDLPKSISNSRATMYADDIKMGRQIRNLEDTNLLQSDLDSLQTWSVASGLVFNATKCKAMSVTRKIKAVSTTYRLTDTDLEKIEEERDLGVWTTNKLTWNKQVSEQAGKANKLLGYIKRNTIYIKGVSIRRTLYLGLIRPHLGYATQVWAPQFVQLIGKLERIQRRATRYILSIPYSSNVDYTLRLKKLNLIPITYWHELQDMIFFFKIIHGLVIIDHTVIPMARNTRSTRSSASNVIKFVVPKCKTTTYQRSYFVRTCRVWNVLADELCLSTNNLISFKTIMLNYYKASLSYYQWDDPRSFKTVCIKCNRGRPLNKPISCCI